MEGEAHFKELSDDLVAKIISMISFPAILKARGLSKTWKARFSSFSADDAEAKRCLVPSFHSDVFERSKTWAIMWIVFMSEGQLFAYNYESQTWRTMLCLSFLPAFDGPPSVPSPPDHPPDHVSSLGAGLLPAILSSDSALVQRTRQQIEGALTLISQHVAGKSRHYTYLTKMYVVNLLTKSWKCLEVTLGVFLRVFYHKLVVDKSSKAYKVIVLDYEGQFGLSTSIGINLYDSASDAWSNSVVQLPPRTALPTSAAYNNGVLYIAPWENVRTLRGDLYVYNLEERTFNRYTLSHPSIINFFPYHWIENVTLLTYKEDLLMVVSTPYLSFIRDSTDSVIRVLRVDFQTGRWVLLPTTLPFQLKLRSLSSSPLFRVLECTIGGDCIFIDIEDSEGRRVLIYNLEDNDCPSDVYIKVPAGPSKWIGPSCFNPSMHTFMSL